jgi:uncharacterized membrane protein YkvA (DUF1232 family)
MGGRNMIRMGLVGRLARDFKLLFSLAKDYWKGNYRDVSLFSIVLFATTIAYILSPFDFLSDFVPGLGQIDDALLLLLCLYFLEKDLYKYRDWKKEDRGRC